MAVVDVTTSSYEAEVVQTEKLVLVDFWTPTCRPCKAMQPILKQIDASLGEKVKVVKVNAEAEPELVKKYEVQGVPTCLLVKEGKILDRKTGYLQPSQLKSWVEGQLLNGV